MKFRVERDVLADAVAWAARSLPSRPPVPVLAGLLLDASDGRLVLSSFDYEVSGRVEIAADIAEPGVALVSGRLLADISRSLPARPVEIATDAAKVVVTCGSSRFSLLTLPVEDYPALPDMPSASGSLRGDSFAAAVAQVSIAAGRDDTLPVLTGVRLEIDGEKITMAATDRYRLAVRDLAWTPEQSGLSAIALVPARTLADTAKSLVGADKVTVALASGSGAEGLVGFEGAGRRTTSRLLDGEFPKYRSLLPGRVTDPRHGGDGRADRVRTPGGAGRRAQHPDPALVRRRKRHPRGRQRRRGAGVGVDGRAAGGRRHLDRVQPGLPPGRPERPGGHAAQLAFTASTRPAVISGKAGADEPAIEDYRYLLMPVRLSG